MERLASLKRAAALLGIRLLILAVAITQVLADVFPPGN